MTFQSHLVERVLLPVSERLTHSKFWSLATRMERFDKLGRAEIEVLQQQRLKQLLDVAAAHTDFWPERLSCPSDAATGGLDGTFSFQRLQTLPSTSKLELEQGFPERVVSIAQTISGGFSGSRSRQTLEI